MPDLQHTLQGHDLGFLKMVAEAWGIELSAADAPAALQPLVERLRQQPLVQEMMAALPTEATAALQTLLENEGRMPWALFCRRFGEVRVMGAARRDRQRPDLNPISPAERLWYRALIGKAFFNLPPEPQEFAYIPDDLIELLAPLRTTKIAPLGRPASPAESAQAHPANDRILDHACTLLAALRAGIDPYTLDTAHWNIPLPVLQALLAAAGLLDASGLPQPESTRQFLEASRGYALAQLAAVWLNSTSFNELRLLPGLKFEGEWRNHPLQARQAVLAMLQPLPSQTWWSLPAFIEAVHQQQPDFQRPAGDYDSWFIRKESNGEYLRGFSSWEEVDGALLRFLITGPLHWLGLFDLASPGPDQQPQAFRLSAWAAALLQGQPPAGLPPENESIRVSSSGRLQLSALTPRVARYQIARFCQWERQGPDTYYYRLTPTALERAQQQGLRPAHLLALLRRYASGPLPPSLIQALERWEKFGVQASLETVVLLHAASPEIMEALRRTPAGRHILNLLTPTIAIIAPGRVEAVRNALAECGYLAEVRLESGGKGSRPLTRGKHV